MALVRSPFRGAILLVALSAAVARAQTPVQAGTTPSAVAAPVTAPVARTLRVDATRLLSGTFTYQTVLERDINSTLLGTRTVSALHSMYAGAPAWLLLEVRTGDAIPGVDSLFSDETSLQPIHWGSTIGRARLSAEFRGDTAFGGTTAPAGRRSMVTAMPAGTLVSGPMLENVLRLLPLQPSYEDSASTLSVTLNGATAIPTRISVIGDDRVRVPAGEFDCWVVSVRAGDSARGLYWVTKTDPIVVRSMLDIPGMNGAQFVSSLTRVVR